MSDGGKQFFTVQQWAGAAGLTPRAVRKMLGRLYAPLGAEVLREGRKVKAWALADVPPRLRKRVEERAAEAGQPISRFLEHLQAPWRPSLDLAEIDARYIEEARDRCEAFAELLRRNGGDADKSLSRLATQGADRLERLRGFAPDRSGLVRMLQRVIDRDRGRGEWERWELYLRERPGKAKAAEDAPARRLKLDGAGVNLDLLRDALAAVQNRDKPGVTERGQIWWRAQNAVICRERHVSEKAALELVTDEILSAGVAFSRNRESLLKGLRQKIRQAEAAGDTYETAFDQRKGKVGRKGFQLSEKDQLTLEGVAMFHFSGEVEPAFRALVEGREFPAEDGKKGFSREACRELGRYSRVPRNILEETRRNLQVMSKWQQGPRAGHLGGAYINRDYFEIQPGDWWEMDDLTPPVWFWEEDENGQPVRDSGGQVKLTQGQMIVTTDLATTMVLAFDLRPEKSYRTADIAELIYQTSCKVGMPAEGWNLERGVWESSLLIGANSRIQNEIPAEDFTRGLREFGQVHHAIKPRSKTIEGIFSHLQKYMDGFRGFTGRDMRRDCPEHVKGWMNDVKAGRIHPGEVFFSHTEIVAKYEGAFEDWNNRRIDEGSKRFPGWIRKEAWETRDTERANLFPEEISLIGSTCRVQRRVTRNGIKVPSSLGGGRYKGDTGHLEGQDVLVWMRPQEKDFAWVTKLDWSEPILLKRERACRAMGETPENLAAAMELNDAQNRHGKSRFRVLKSTFGREQYYRKQKVSRKILEGQEEMQRQERQHKETRQRQQQAANRVQRFNLPAGLDAADLTPEQLAAAERLNNSLKTLGHGSPVNLNQDRQT